MTNTVVMLSFFGFNKPEMVYEYNIKNSVKNNDRLIVECGFLFHVGIRLDIVLYNE